MLAEGSALDLRSKNSFMCVWHKRPIVLICKDKDCTFSPKRMCGLCDNTIHSEHQDQIEAIETMAKNRLQVEKQKANEKISEINNTVNRIKSKLHRSLKHNEDPNDLQILAEKLQEIQLSENLESKPYSPPQTLNIEFKDIAIQSLSILERKEMALTRLLGYSLRTDNLFEIANSFHINRNQRIMRENQQQNHLPPPHQQRQSLSTLPPPHQNPAQITQSDNAIVAASAAAPQIVNQELQPQQLNTPQQSFLSPISIAHKTLSGVIRSGRNELMFWTDSAVYYYDYESRSVLASKYFHNCMIMECTPIGQTSGLAVAHLRRSQTMVVFFFGMWVSLQLSEVVLLSRKGDTVECSVLLTQEGMSAQPLTCISMFKEPIILVLSQQNELFIVNYKSKKIINRIRVFANRVEPAGGVEPLRRSEIRRVDEVVVSCSLVNNVTIAGRTYANLLAINTMNGKYRLFDFTGNGRTVFETDTQVRIPSFFPTYGNWGDGKRRNSGEENQTNVILGTQGQAYFQNVNTGRIEKKQRFLGIEFFDKFHNQTAMPVYESNSLYFWDVEAKKRLKSIQLNRKERYNTRFRKFYDSFFGKLPKNAFKKPKNAPISTAIITAAAPSINQNERMQSEIKPVVENKPLFDIEKQDSLKSRFASAWDTQLDKFNRKNVEILSERKKKFELEQLKRGQALKKEIKKEVFKCYFWNELECIEDPNENQDEIGDYHDYECYEDHDFWNYNPDYDDYDEEGEFSSYESSLSDSEEEEEQESESEIENSDNEDLKQDILEIKNSLKQNYNLTRRAGEAKMEAIKEKEESRLRELDLLLSNTCPLAVFNTFKYIIVVYTTGDIQYIR